jgi:hypothetical protein
MNIRSNDQLADVLEIFASDVVTLQAPSLNATAEAAELRKVIPRYHEIAFSMAARSPDFTRRQSLATALSQHLINEWTRWKPHPVLSNSPPIALLTARYEKSRRQALLLERDRRQSSLENACSSCHTIGNSKAL